MKAEKEREEQEAWELAKQLVQIDSSDPGAYEEEIGLWITDWFKKQIADFGGKMADQIHVSRLEVLPGRFNVMAKIPGKTEGPGLIYICHMDTVMLGDGWDEDISPLSAMVRDGKMYGRGACDMKSGLACALTAFKYMVKKVGEKGELPQKPFAMICSVDEEDFMRGVEAAIKAGWGTKDDWILDTEPTDGQIQVAHKGRTWFELTMTGITAHASKPEKGADAIFAASKFIVQIQEIFEHFPVHEELGYSTITFGQIQGGYQPYVVPDACTIFIDCRLAPPVTDQIVVQHFNKIIKEIETQIPGIKISYDITGNRPYIEKNPGSILLKNLKEAVEAETKQKAVVKAFTGYTDTAVIAGRLHNTECMSYGPGSLQYAHKPDEFVEIRDIIRCEKVMNHLVMSLCEER